MFLKRGTEHREIHCCREVAPRRIGVLGPSENQVLALVVPHLKSVNFVSTVFGHEHFVDLVLYFLLCKYRT